MVLKNRLILIMIILLPNLAFGKIQKKAVIANEIASNGSDISGDSKYSASSNGLVNMLTGTPSYELNLLELSSKTGLTYKIKLSYNGSSRGMPVQGTVSKYIYKSSCQENRD